MKSPRDTHNRFEWAPLYKVSPTFERTPETARLVHDELGRLRRNDGVLDPHLVVEAASDEGSVLHPAFTWKDEDAAKRWRVEQARDLIRGVRVIHVMVQDDGSEGEGEPIQAYASYTPERQPHGYREVYVALGDEKHREALLREAKADMQRFKHRYACLKELADVFIQIDRLL